MSFSSSARYGTPLKPDDLLQHQLLDFMDGPAQKLVSCDDKPHGTFPLPDNKSRVVCDDEASMKVRVFTDYLLEKIGDPPLLERGITIIHGCGYLPTLMRINRCNRLAR